tara:strand:+ start:271 stop:483 length:213 start_codon:yes stop_codon:yes gene_type:complete
MSEKDKNHIKKKFNLRIKIIVNIIDSFDEFGEKVIAKNYILYGEFFVFINAIFWHLNNIMFSYYIRLVDT